MSKSATRIQTSFLAGSEKKLLGYLVKKIPDFITSDCLTWIGVTGAFTCAIGFVLANYNLQWLWISSLGLVINWFGDSLDGSLARYRNTQRPIYGFFIDHSLDAFTILIMCIGAALSPLFHFSIPMLVLSGYLILSIFTYLGTILKDEFKLTYGCFGPTEFRLIIILLNTIAIIIPYQYWEFSIQYFSFSIFDAFGFVIIIIIFALDIFQFITDLKYFAKIDPLPPFHRDNQR